MCDVCETHVKPSTSLAGGTKSLSFVSLLNSGSGGSRKGKSASGEAYSAGATHFVSYTWMFTFRDLLAIIQHFESEHPKKRATDATNYDFVDQFSLDQHAFSDNCTATSQEEQARLVATLSRNITTPKRVLVCLAPWDNPKPLTRSWCVFV